MSNKKKVIDDEFVERMKILVEKIGSQAALSLISGVNQTTISSYLRGSEPSRIQLVALAEACGVPIEWLARGDENKIENDIIAIGSKAEICADRCGNITVQSKISPHNNNAENMMEVSPRERKILQLMRLHFSNARLMELECELNDLEQTHRQKRLRNE